MTDGEVLLGVLIIGGVSFLTYLILATHTEEQEQMSALSDAVEGVKAQVAEVKEGVDRVLAALNSGDTDAAIAELTNIATALGAVDASLDAAVPENPEG